MAGRNLRDPPLGALPGTLHHNFGTKKKGRPAGSSSTSGRPKGAAGATDEPPTTSQPMAREDVSEKLIFWGSHFGHLTWTFFGGGERIRTADFYDANV
jgi:hypothetical protein